MIKRFAIISLFAASAVGSLVLTPHEIVVEIPAVVCEPERESELTVISDYDSIMQTVEGESGVDWRLLSAIAYTESRFRNDLTSPGGAVGLMQIQPSTARHFGISAESLKLPHNNIRVAAFLLREIERLIKLPSGLSDEDRLGILLACYNCGIGHVSDARRLARASGEDMNSWPRVSHYLKLKSDPEYYEMDVVRAGRFNSGIHTANYVTKVLKRYEHYCRLTDTTARR